MSLNILRWILVVCGFGGAVLVCLFANRREPSWFWSVIALISATFIITALNLPY